MFILFLAGCVSWVAMYPPAGLPKDMVEPTIGGSDYWANKVRMQYRKTNPEQVRETLDCFRACGWNGEYRRNCYV